MLNTKSSVLSLIVVGVLVSGCQTPAPTASFADITFIHLAPINVNVAKIEVKNSYHAGIKGKHVEDRFPVSPAKALRRWAGDRLKPVGGPGSGTLRMTITDAGVIESKLKKDETVKGVFTTQQSHRYQLKAGGRLEIYDASGKRAASSDAQATRTVTTGEDITLNEREKVWFEATEKLMADFNRQMEREIHQFLGKWVK